MVLIISYVIILISMTGCGAAPSPTSKTDIYFDTVVTITLYGSDAKYIDKCFELCAQYEKLFSKTISTSEISMINENSKKGIYTTVSDETLELLQYGLQYSALSEGKFDITVGRLAALWHFDTQDTKKPSLPSEHEIAETVKNIGYQQIVIKGNDVLLANPFTSIDLGGIAKGYIADRLKDYLLKNNVKKGIINLGGNILLIGNKPDNTNYNIGIQMPFANDGSTIAVVNTKDKSIVTSGVYERYFFYEEELYHHILDTSTGYPVNNSLLSVTIISEQSVDGDGLSTSAFVLGLEDGLALIEGLDNTEAILIDKDYQLHLTTGLTLKDGVIYLN